MSSMLSRKKLTARQISLDMHEDDAERLLSFLHCRECGELAQDAVETACCHALLCSGCMERRPGHECPDCQAACGHAPSHLARRLIGTQPWRCPNCGKETTRSEQADHGLICPQGERRCPADGCAFRGLSDAFLVHLTEAHGSQLLRWAECLFEPATSSKESRRRSDSSESIVYGGDSSSVDMFEMPDLRLLSRPFYPNGRREASRSRTRLTGKNYCQGPLNGPPCNCCDGACGPDNGCNCVDCMRRDLVTFGVRTPRTLVNREGAVARISDQTGQFYCGRPVMRHDPSTDGFCGPRDGNNCHACGRLDEQLLGRYAEIAAEWEGDGTRDAFDLSDAFGVASAVAFDTID